MHKPDSFYCSFFLRIRTDTDLYKTHAAVLLALISLPQNVEIRTKIEILYMTANI